MKKIFVAMLALAAAACSNEDIVSVNQEAIGFDNAFINNSVRSVDPSYSNTKLFTDFAVYGYVSADNQAPAAIFDGTQVSGPDWTYEGTQYWINGAYYNFNAVAPKTNGGWTKTAADATSTTLSFTNNGTTDLLYAKNVYGTYNYDKTQPVDKVGFTFRHVLSKVKFSFVNTYNATNATIRVKNVQITDAYKTGTVTLTDATEWSAQADKLTLKFGNAAVASATSEEDFGYNSTLESYNELLLIPGAGQTVVDGKNTYTITFTVDLLVGGTLVKSYPHTINAEFAPEAGNSYNLTATINAENIDPEQTQEAIKFTVTGINGWDTDHNDDGEDNDETTIL